MFLTDCTYLDDVGSDKTDEGWVNWGKLEGLAKKIRDILRPRMKHYNLHAVPQIQKFIEEAESWNDTKALYAISQLSEAKAPVGGAEASGFAAAARRAGGSAAARRGMGARRSTLSNLQAFRQSGTHSPMAPSMGTGIAPKDDPYALSEREWKILSAGATLKKYEAQQVISEESEDDRFIYRVHSGKAKVERVPPLDPTAAHVTIATASEKDLIGEISLLKAHRVAMSGRIVAVEASEVHQIGVDYVLKICESESDLSEKLHRILALKLARRLRNINASKSRGAGAAAQAPPQPDAATTRLPSNQGLSSSQVIMPDEDEAKKADEKFVKKFNLPSAEVIIRAIDCSLKQKVVSHGTMFVSQGYVCYSASVFGLKKKEVIPLPSISKIEQVAKAIQITTDADKVFMFSSFDEPVETLDFLTTLWQNVTEKLKSSGEDRPASLSSSSSAQNSPAPKNTPSKKRSKSNPRGDDDKEKDKEKEEAVKKQHSRSTSSLDAIPEAGDAAEDHDSNHPGDQAPAEPVENRPTRSLTDSGHTRDRSGSEGGLHLNIPTISRDRADSQASSSPRATEERKLAALRARYDLTEEDWENILKGASVTTFNKDQPVITEGDKMQRIYQVGRGTCRIEKALLSDEKQKLVLGRFVKDDGVFGEISFLEGGAASASVVADEPETAIHIIEGYFLDVLFQRTPGLSGRFYHYLASLLAKRVALREGAIAMPASPRPNKPPPPIPRPQPAFTPPVPVLADQPKALSTETSGTTSDDHPPSSPTKIHVSLQSPEKRRGSRGSQDGENKETPSSRTRRGSESEESEANGLETADLTSERKKKRGSQRSGKRRSMKVSDSTGSVQDTATSDASAPPPAAPASDSLSNSATENDEEDSSSARDKKDKASSKPPKSRKRTTKRSSSMAPSVAKSVIDQ